VGFDSPPIGGAGVVLERLRKPEAVAGDGEQEAAGGRDRQIVPRGEQNRGKTASGYPKSSRNYPGIDRFDPNIAKNTRRLRRIQEKSLRRGVETELAGIRCRGD